MPVGLTNNNYLNVKNGSDPWMNAGGKPAKSDSKGHAVFTDPAYGVRAGILLLRTYFLTHNLQTILEILSRWAPVTDTIGSQPGADPNNPTAYAIFVSGRMGVGHNQKLELFNPDKTIRNVGQLRGLFYAMAAFEIGGGFKVPDKDFNAGLELVEAGITSLGTGTGQPPVDALQPAAKGWKISGSVGRVDKGAVNKPADVSTVQSMLRSAAMILNEPRIDPGGLDGKIDPVASKSDTVKAIVAFQSRYFTKPDGLIAVGGRTWGELLAIVSGAVEPVPVAADGEFFPFASLPSADWTSGPRRFSANRAGNRAHAGCDLYFPKGTTIHAITAGTVVRGPYPFYAGTFALEVDHGSFLARYGEVQNDTIVREGDRVTAGQPIARVGHLVGISVPSDMLHLEIYDKTQHGPLTTSAAGGAFAPNGRPYMRRKDLHDPTTFLDRWKNHLPGSPVVVVAGNVVATPPKIPATGFCLHIQRIRQEKRDGKIFARTISDYQCYWDGQPIHDLGGQMVERNGPGDNSGSGVQTHRRIKEGKYRLSIHHGARYKTYKYSASGFPLPGLLFLDTGERSAILLHPCHENDGYLSSIGCLNPGDGLTNANSRINLADSRSRVIAIIEGMKAKLGTGFPKQDLIPGAVALIEGEPA